MPMSNIPAKIVHVTYAMARFVVVAASLLAIIASSAASIEPEPCCQAKYIESLPDFLPQQSFAYHFAACEGRCRPIADANGNIMDRKCLPVDKDGNAMENFEPEKFAGYCGCSPPPPPEPVYCEVDWKGETTTGCKGSCPEDPASTTPFVSRRCLPVDKEGNLLIRWEMTYEEFVKTVDHCECPDCFPTKVDDSHHVAECSKVSCSEYSDKRVCGLKVAKTPFEGREYRTCGCVELSSNRRLAI